MGKMKYLSIINGLWNEITPPEIHLRGRILMGLACRKRLTKKLLASSWLEGEIFHMTGVRTTILEEYGIRAWRAISRPDFTMSSIDGLY